MSVLKLTRLMLLTTALLWTVQPAAVRVLASLDSCSCSSTAEIDKEADLDELELKSLSTTEPNLAAPEFASFRRSGSPKISASMSTGTRLHLRGPPAA